MRGIRNVYTGYNFDSLKREKGRPPEGAGPNESKGELLLRPDVRPMLTFNHKRINRVALLHDMNCALFAD